MTCPPGTLIHGDVVGLDVEGIYQRCTVYKIERCNLRGLHIHFTAENGLDVYRGYYGSKIDKEPIDLLEMADKDSRARTRNWPECREYWGIKD